MLLSSLGYLATLIHTRAKDTLDINSEWFSCSTQEVQGHLRLARYLHLF
jgi:hypothetical protein